MEEIIVNITRDFPSIDDIEEKLKEKIFHISSKELSLEEKSHLIETVLLDVPVILLAIARRAKKEERGGVDIIVGGEIPKTMIEFRENKFKLKGMSIFKDLEGKYFNEFPRFYKYPLWYKQFILFSIKPPTPQYLKYSIIKRFKDIYEKEITKEDIREVFYKSREKAWELVNEYAFKIFKKKNKTTRRMILEAIAIYLIRKGDIEWKDIPEKRERNINKAVIILNKKDNKDIREKIKKEYLNGITVEKLKKEFPCIYKKVRNDNRIGALIYLLHKIKSNS